MNNNEIDKIPLSGSYQNMRYVFDESQDMALEIPPLMRPIFTTVFHSDPKEHAKLGWNTNELIKSIRKTQTGSTEQPHEP